MSARYEYSHVTRFGKSKDNDLVAGAPGGIELDKEKTLTDSVSRDAFANTGDRLSQLSSRSPELPPLLTETSVAIVQTCRPDALPNYVERKWPVRCPFKWSKTEVDNPACRF